MIVFLTEDFRTTNCFKSVLHYFIDTHIYVATVYLSGTNIEFVKYDYKYLFTIQL